MSRVSDGHFSESITFEADGLDDILKKVREGRNETDLFHASGLRLNSLFGRSGGLAASLSGGLGGTGGTASYRPRPSLASPFPSTAGLSATAAAMAEASYVERANRAARLGQPIPLASGAGSQTYGLQTDTISDQAHRRRRQMDADRLVRDQQPPGPPPLPAQGVASWERLKRNAQGYREEVARVAAEYQKFQRQMTTRAGNWFHGDPMTRALRENAQKARRDLDAAEQARRRAIGFRGRFGEDWHGQDGRGGYAGGLRTAGNLAIGAGVGVFGLGMAGLQGTVTGNRFNNEWERTVRELGNSFGPALREATGWLEKFNQWLSKLSPSGQRMIAAGGIAAAGYAGLRAVGAEGVVHEPLKWAAAGAAAGGMRLGGALAGGASALGSAMGVSALGAAGIVAAPAAYAYSMWSAHRNAQGRMDRDDRWGRREYTADEIGRFREATAAYDQIEDPAERRRKLIADEAKALREQSKMEEQYSTFGRLLGSIKDPIFGFSPGSYGRVEGEHRARLEAINAKRAGVDLELKRNVEPLAGGGFESLMQTYQRIESAFGKIDKGKAEEKLAGAAEMLMKAVIELGKQIQANGGRLPAAQEEPRGDPMKAAQVLG